MAFLVWLLGVAMIAASVGIVYKYAKEIVWPYNKFVFEHTNEYGVLVFEKYEDKIAHDKIKAQNKVKEFMIAIPAVPLFVIGNMFFMNGVLNLLGRGF